MLNPMLVLDLGDHELHANLRVDPNICQEGVEGQ
jgi:hypothetical protein